MKYECKENDAVIELGRDKDEVLIYIQGEVEKTVIGLKDLHQALNIFGVSKSVCPKCGNTGRCEPRTLSDPDGQECDCGANCCRSFQIGQTVYHRNVYEHKEPLKIVGILEDKLLLEGDFSGGTHNVIQRDWLPIKGTSRIYNHAFKLKARKDAIAIETLAIPCAGSQDNTFKCMIDMVHDVMVLTNDVSLNPECE